MVIDSSAVIAVVRGEPEAPRIAQAIERDPVRQMSTGNALETAMVAEGLFGDEGARLLDSFFFETGVDFVAFSPEHFRLARQAFRRFGKGHHSAALSFGDCMSYATAVVANEPLLFKGDDFAQTDVVVAPY